MIDMYIGNGYTQAWVDFLIERMNKEEEYNSLFEKS